MRLSRTTASCSAQSQDSPSADDIRARVVPASSFFILPFITDPPQISARRAATRRQPPSVKQAAPCLELCTDDGARLLIRGKPSAANAITTVPPRRCHRCSKHRRRRRGRACRRRLTPPSSNPLTATSVKMLGLLGLSCSCHFTERPRCFFLSLIAPRPIAVTFARLSSTSATKCIDSVSRCPVCPRDFPVARTVLRHEN
ncbi:hypothetical protein HPB51_009159 [Rhipicephalus microplus]|uniref:Uncharacterized protein n=1 Tax=Rhipicephalus microplus TaxID=6941 RepID=A0A9J6F090_RHIMP|nr:hypothetical protein HPB51_009159 [Rhipicephalus microplus]